MSRPLALITGGTSGIGLGIAKKLAPEFDLALSYASNEEKANAAVQDIQSLFPDSTIRLYKQVLQDEATCKNLFQNVVAESGKNPAVLVNSAGRLQDGLFMQADFEKYISVVHEHLIASMALCQLVLKSMYKERWGRIINLSSISANYSKRGQSNYAAAKAGLEAFTRTLALEVAHRGITVNAIAPGLIETPMTQAFVSKVTEGDGDLRQRIPVGRIGQPQEVGSLVAFLCSKDAAYITGSVMTIDGGRSLGDSAS